MRKIVLSLAGVLLAVSSFATAASLDVVVEWMHSNGLTKYDTAVEFRAEDAITRGEASKFVKQFGDMMELPDTYTECEFVDTANYDTTLLASIDGACKLGLLKGGNGYFSPNATMTRAQGLVVVVRSLDGFLDETGTPWYKSYYDAAMNKGIIDSSVALNSLDNENITRGELGTWFYMASQVVMGDDSMDDEMNDDMEDEEVDTATSRYELYSESAFDAALARGDTVVLNFRASWCPTCKATSENIIANKDQIPEGVVVLEVDYDEYKALKQQYGVIQQTTFVYIKGDTHETITTVRGIDDLLANL